MAAGERFTRARDNEPGELGDVHTVSGVIVSHERFLEVRERRRRMLAELASPFVVEPPKPDAVVEPPVESTPVVTPPILTAKP